MYEHNLGVHLEAKRWAVTDRIRIRIIPDDCFPTHRFRRFGVSETTRGSDSDGGRSSEPTRCSRYQTPGLIKPLIRSVGCEVSAISLMAFSLGVRFPPAKSNVSVRVKRLFPSEAGPVQLLAMSALPAQMHAYIERGGRRLPPR